jgi:hypothetical protein
MRHTHARLLLTNTVQWVLLLKENLLLLEEVKLVIDLGCRGAPKYIVYTLVSRDVYTLVSRDYSLQEDNLSMYYFKNLKV